MNSEETIKEAITALSGKICEKCVWFSGNFSDKDKAYKDLNSTFYLFKCFKRSDTSETTLVKETDSCEFFQEKIRDNY